LLATMSTYYTVRLAVNKEKHLRQILLFLLALMVFEAVVGLMQAVSGEGVIYVRSEPGGNLFPRATGTLGNGLGWYLSVGFIIALNLWLHSKRTARSALSVAALAIISSGLIVANTRGAWVDCAIATGVSLVPVLSSKRLRRKALLACSVALALVGVILIGEDSRERLSSVWEQVLNPAQSTVGFRFYVWESAVEMFKSRPAVGVGQDNFKPLLPDYVSPLANRYLRVSADRSYTVHHAGLQILAESGLAGAATFALFVFAYIRQAFAVHRLLRVTDEGVAKALLVFALMSTLSILYGGYSFGGYTQVGRLYFIMVGLTVAQADVIRRLRKHQ
jgi:O-antigen ligase